MTAAIAIQAQADADAQKAAVPDSGVVLTAGKKTAETTQTTTTQANVTVEKVECSGCGRKLPAGTEKCPDCQQILTKDAKKVETPKEEPKVEPVKEMKKEDTPKPSLATTGKGSDKKNLSLPGQILIHLIPAGRYRNAGAVPIEYTQKGMESALNTPRVRITQALGYLDEKKYITSADMHVKGEPRVFKVYFLTIDGEKRAHWLKENQGQNETE